MYDKLLANDGALIKADTVTQKDMDAVMEPISIDNAHLFEGGAKELANLLKKYGGGNPRVVKKAPEWLAKKVSRAIQGHPEIDGLESSRKIF